MAIKKYIIHNNANLIYGYCYLKNALKKELNVIFCKEKNYLINLQTLRSNMLLYIAFL